MDNLEDHIDDYLMGRLEGRALKTFEQKMKVDQAFAKEVAEQKQAIEVLEKLADAKIKSEAIKVGQQFKKTKKAKSKFSTLLPWIAVASSLLLLILVYFSLQNESSQDLFEDYYSAYDTGFGERGINNNQEVKLAEASRFYKQKDFKKALTIFENIEGIESGKLELMTGISYLEIGAYDKAIQFFIPLVEDKDPVFQYHGLWYMAMTYLKSGAIENCKIQLQKLIDVKDPNGVYKQAEAKRLLKKI